MSNDRESTIKIAESYLFKGLIEQKPEEIPLADNCTRTELGFNTGKDANHLRALLSSEAYDNVLDCYDLNWIVEGAQACVFYKQKLKQPEVPILVATRFKIENDLIHEIEIILYCPGMTDLFANEVKKAMGVD